MLCAVHCLRRVHVRHSPRRGYITEAFCDLATALPYPFGWPPYSSTIILGTILSRIAALPVAFWANNRSIRYQKYVMSGEAAALPQLQHNVLNQMRVENFMPGNKPAWEKEFAKRIEPARKSKRKELCLKHNCRIAPTIIVPSIVQMALFVPCSVFLSHIAADPFSSFDTESFLMLTSLTHTDDTLILPITVGLLTMANVESRTWFMTVEEIEQRNIQRTKRIKLREQGIVKVDVGGALKNGMGLVSLLRMAWATQVSGAVVLFWTASAVCGLLQTWYTEHLQRKHLEAAEPVKPSTTRTQKPRLIVASKVKSKPRKL